MEAVLARVRPFMQADGGDIELVDVSGNSAGVRLTGMCAGCPSTTDSSEERIPILHRASEKA